MKVELRQVVKDSMNWWIQVPKEVQYVAWPQQWYAMRTAPSIQPQRHEGYKWVN